MLFLIAAPKLENKAVQLFKEGNVPVQYHLRAQGAASSEIMNMLGLDGGEKIILMSMMPKMFADEMLVKLYRKLHLGMPDSGIAFTIAMSGCSSHMIKLIETLQPENGRMVLERDEVEMMESEYSLSGKSFLLLQKKKINCPSCRQSGKNSECRVRQTELFYRFP